MGFFKSLPPEDQLENLPRPGRPAWLAPPGTYLPEIIPYRNVIARSATAAVALLELRVYPQGCLFEFTSVAHLPEPATTLPDVGRETLQAMFSPPLPGEPLSPKLLRLGVALSDGRTATTIEAAHLYAYGPGEPRPPVFMASGGHANLADEHTICWQEHLWLWPAPPAETFDLVVEWPAFGIDETRTSIDGATITEAAGNAFPHWPDSQYPSM
jgi:hypothetical protein